jgi:hypothetical protein
MTPATYVARYWLNAALVSLTVISVAGNIVVATASAAFLGLTEIQWHWVVLVFAIATALSAAFNPAIIARPTVERLQLEHDLHRTMLAKRERAA